MAGELPPATIYQMKGINIMLRVIVDDTPLGKNFLLSDARPIVASGDRLIVQSWALGKIAYVQSDVEELTGDSAIVRVRVFNRSLSNPLQLRYGFRNIGGKWERVHSGDR